MSWYKLFGDETVHFNVLTKTLPTKGNLVYEYNPLRNYRLSRNMYEYKNKLYSLGELYDNFGITLKIEDIVRYKKKGSSVYQYGTQIPIDDIDSVESSSDSNIYGQWFIEAYKPGKYADRANLENFLQSIKENLQYWIGVPDNETDPILHESGELVDFDTEELKISLNHPVHIVPQYSYDGSVNLIINDGINIPRLINSRFSATGRNTYEIIDRKGNNDTNIYDQGDQFDIDTSLYKRVVKIPKIKFTGVHTGGNLKVGNYHFYFKFADADGNETDFVGESGLVSVFVGFDSYHSVHTGQKNENSFKQVSFLLTDIDSSYDYVTVYYSRNTAEANYNRVTEYCKIDKKFIVNNADCCNILITGFEDVENVTVSDINLQYNVVDAVTSSAVCQNMLFMANVHKPDIPYTELQDLSLRFLPSFQEERYDVQLDHNYGVSTTNLGYIDPKFIYEKTGYWPEEIYRFGIVYLLNNGSLSPVFNIRGCPNIKSNTKYTDFPLFNENGERNYIDYNEENFLITDSLQKENIKGVLSFSPNNDSDYIYSIKVNVSDEVITELKKYVKGFFFVRQTRIPSILSQGITLGIDNESRTPTIPTCDGFLKETADMLRNNTHADNTLGDINYISEGFLSRYQFSIEEKNANLKKAGKIAAVVAGVVCLAAATVFTCGAAGIIAAGAATAIVAGSAAAGAVVVGGTYLTAWGENKLNQSINKDKIKLDGRNTKIPKGYEAKETENSRMLTQEFQYRFIPKDSDKNSVQCIICPDYEINQPYYNQIFTGNDHLIKTTKSQRSIEGSKYFDNNNNRHFYIPNYSDSNTTMSSISKIIAVPDGIKCVGVDDLIFRARAGEAEEAWQYECIGNAYKSEKDYDTEISNKKINSDIIRGNFGAYLGFNNPNNKIGACEIVNIYVPGYSESNLDKYFDIRMRDNSVFNAVTDRIDIHSLSHESVLVGNTNVKDSYDFNIYRGDCYLCQFTHRVNRNFNDPSAPYNDNIVDENSWKDNYDPANTEKYSDINLGDVNAIQLGMWVTFKLRSSNNLNVRSLDGSNVEETAMSGHERGYYPYYPMSVEGSYKLPDSQVYNKGFAKSLSDRWNFEVPDVPHIKNWFGTRIMYSDIHINDAYKNGFRVFQGTNYRDYTREYGSITKIVPFESSLLVVFEHGVALLPVNERAVAGQGAGGNVYINTSNVLPENPKIISDMFGSQWAESILKVPGKTGDAAQYVYGVDTVAKKIWRTDGNTLQCISDMRVQEFLNNNITLGERELTPKIGIRNVKTVYNAFKRDVLFTFYDNTYGFEEKVWNLCWNELLGKFITFYSWVPSYMENINNIPFSFNRDTSKWIAKLGTSHAENSIADGVTLSNVIVNNKVVNDRAVDNYKFKFKYINKEGKEVSKTYTVAEESRDNFIGVLSLSNRTLPNDQLFYQIEYSLERDSYQNYKNFEIVPIKIQDGKNVTDGIVLPQDAKYSKDNILVTIYALKFKKTLQDQYYEVYYSDNSNYINVLDANDYINEEDHYVYTKGNSFEVKSLLSELYKRNIEQHSYADYSTNAKNYVIYEKGKAIDLEDEALRLPIYKDITGKRVTLKREEQLNPDKIVTLLNIKATIKIINVNGENKMSDDYYNLQAGFASGTTLIDAGYYESVVAIAPKWNLQFLSSDFWKHGQGGLIDIADDIYPTYWYGKTHPFEFECVVVNDPSVHKIFTNLELVANKAKPESFHYEIIGETYDFAKDKPNMYFRQEAKKALWQYNGSDISYNRNFLKTQPIQQAKSADLPYKYYYRKDGINEIEDYYHSINLTSDRYSYKHLSGAEIVYYPNRQEYRIWQHTPAVNLDDLSQDTGRSIISANCQYLEDRWKITINPIIVCYKNEGKLWKGESSWTSPNRPPLTIKNSPIPNDALEEINENNGRVMIPDELWDLGYTADDMDTTNWLDDISIYKTSFGEAQNRKEVDIRDKFMKVRIRYSGEELAVIDFLNTIYRVSYA